LANTFPDAPPCVKGLLAENRLIFGFVPLTRQLGPFSCRESAYRATGTPRFPAPREARRAHIGAINFGTKCDATERELVHDGGG
jgi:hypothetical protein